MNELKVNTNSQDSSWLGFEKYHHSPPNSKLYTPHKGYIEVALRVSKLPNYECHQFFVSLCNIKLTLNTIKSNTSIHMKTCA